MRGARIVIRGDRDTPEKPRWPLQARGKKVATWREELEGEILRRVWDLSMTSDQFYELATQKLNWPIFDLVVVSRRDLAFCTKCWPRCAGRRSNSPKGDL